MQKAKTLVGLAIDVSGSMETSIRNEADGQLTRFESFQRALDHLLNEAREVVKIKKNKAEYSASLDLFVYCFGLKDNVVEVSDLLSLMKLGNKSIQQSKKEEEQNQKVKRQRKRYSSQNPFQELENIAERYRKPGYGAKAREYFSKEQAQVLVLKLRENSSRAERLASLIPDNWISGSAQYAGSFVGAARKPGEEAINYAFSLIREGGIDVKTPSRDEIRQRVSNRLKKDLDCIGDSTLSIEEIIELWEQNDIFQQEFEEMIYGGTPMCKALQIVKDRFNRDLTRQNGALEDYQDLVLFLLSDGQPTDGNPLPIVRELKSMGVTIICCLIDSKDVSDPQKLFNRPDSSWHQNAQLMFDMASEIEEKSHFANFLLEKNWTINPQAKLFIQLNHSKVLEEFIQIILSPLNQENLDDLPRGYR